MSEESFEPRIAAFVCNWCTYLGADLAGTNRLEYPANVRIIRLPCTGRIDFNLVVKALEIGADAVLVSGCHPGDCHYTAGNYHARRRWMLFRPLLETLGYDLRRVHFTWISAAEGKKFQQTISEITEAARALGPAKLFAAQHGDRSLETCEKIRGTRLDNGSYDRFRQASPECPRIFWKEPPPPEPRTWSVEEEKLRAAARKLLEDGTVKVVIGHGKRGLSRNPGDTPANSSSPLPSRNHPGVSPDFLTAPTGPVFITKPEDAAKLVWNQDCVHNLTAYLKRKEIRALGTPAVVVKKCDERALMVLEKESQISRAGIHVIPMPCEGMNQPKCASCEEPSRRYDELESFLQLAPEDRMSYWAAELDRCVKCYACRQVCPLCYCERCIADKNRPQVIDTSASLEDNFAWHVMRAFHLAGRCIGCDECTRGCPSGINLRLLNLAAAKAAEDCFGYRAGYDPAAEPILGAYSLQDKENFIR